MPDQPTHDPSINCWCLYCRRQAPSASSGSLTRAQGGVVTAEQLARLFHETYERLAPQHGYETRVASAKPWSEVPANNRALMIATCAHVLDELQLGAYAQGYADAVARLRDDERYGDWWSASPESVRPTEPIRGHLADYLETVGPAGPDVTKPATERLRAQAVYENLTTAVPGTVFAFEQPSGDRVLVVVGQAIAAEPWPAKHTGPVCACGYNTAGQQYVDPACRVASDGVPEIGQAKRCFKCGGTDGDIVDRADSKGYNGTDSPYRFMHAYGHCPDGAQA